MVGYLTAFVIAVLITPVALYWWTKHEEEDNLENGSNTEEGI